MHINKWNHKLAEEMRKVVATMNTLQNASSHACLHDAASNICLRSYSMYAASIARVENYEMESISDLKVCVSSRLHPSAPKRMCMRNNTNSPFSCSGCEIFHSHEMQCIHSVIANNGAFVKEQFAIRHMWRERVMGSYIKMDGASNTVDEISSKVIHPASPDTDIELQFTTTADINSESH